MHKVRMEFKATNNSYFNYTNLLINFLINQQLDLIKHLNNSIKQLNPRLFSFKCSK